MRLHCWSHCAYIRITMQYKTTELASKLSIHPNTLRNLLKKYGEYIPHQTIHGEAIYEDLAIERVGEIRQLISDGYNGDRLRNQLSKKYKAVLEGVESNEPNKTPQQSNQSNVPTNTLLVREAETELVKHMDLMLHTQREHNNELQYKQEIIDKKNARIEELQREADDYKAKIQSLEASLKRLKVLPWNK